MANAWGASFLRHLWSELEAAPLDEPPRLMRQMGQTAQALFHAHLHAPADAAVCTVLGVSALMLSADQVLGVELGRVGRAQAMVERSLVLSYQAFIRNVCMPLLQSEDRPESLLSGMNFLAWGRGMPHTMRDAETRGYPALFAAHGAPHLAQIMQTADQAWIKALASYRRAQCERQWHARAQHPGFAPFHFMPARQRPVARRPDTVFELDLGIPAAWSGLAGAGRSPAVTALAGWG